MPGPKGKNASRGFTLVEILIVLGIMGILASISIPNFRSYVQKAEYASMMTTLKYLMDGEDFYILENDAFFKVNVPSGTAMDVPELAYSFPDGHKNRYRIQVVNNSRRNRYKITVYCDFDSDGDGRDDRFTAITNIVNGEVRKNILAEVAKWWEQSDDFKRGIGEYERVINSKDWKFIQDLMMGMQGIIANDILSKSFTTLETRTRLLPRITELC